LGFFKEDFVGAQNFEIAISDKIRFIELEN
jgi:hypothetical protein